MHGEKKGTWAGRIGLITAAQNYQPIYIVEIDHFYLLLKAKPLNIPGRFKNFSASSNPFAKVNNNPVKKIKKV